MSARSRRQFTILARQVGRLFLPNPRRIMILAVEILLLPNIISSKCQAASRSQRERMEEACQSIIISQSVIICYEHPLSLPLHSLINEKCVILSLAISLRRNNERKDRAQVLVVQSGRIQDQGRRRERRGSSIIKLLPQQGYIYLGRMGCYSCYQ